MTIFPFFQGNQPVASAADSTWEKCRTPMVPRRTIDGGWTSHYSQTWRMRTDSGTLYRQDPEDEQSVGFWQW